jgi:predicted RNA-binding protein
VIARRNPMCEVNAYIIKDGKEELYLENVNVAKSEQGKVLLRNLFGEQKEFDGIIREFSLPGHRILLEGK